jgi:tetratricopeptide (TPR) repeat protein
MRKAVRWRSIAVLLSGMLACLALALPSCGTTRNAPMTVEDAYALRMAGHADSARAVLQQILAEDSTRAAAWYELARTNHHIGLGNPRDMLDHLERIDHAASKAAAYAPQNAAYAFYKGYVGAVRAYVALMRQQPDAGERAKGAVAALETAVNLKSDYLEPMLFLVELLSIPAEMGGDSARAEEFAAKLEALDEVLGAKAREMLLPEEIDRVEFWQGILAKHVDNAEALEQLGRAYLHREDAERGTENIRKAVTADAKRQTALLDLARFHMMRARSNEQVRDSAMVAATGLIKEFVDSKPIPSLQAYGLGLSFMIESAKGDTAKARELRTQAEALDPNFSKAFGVPPALLFTGLDELPHYHSHFFRPF